MSKKIDAESYEIEKGLYLVAQTISHGDPNKKKAVETPTNHIACIDVSGSMTSDLPKIREQLKKKLPKLLKEDDTLSMVWFSGRGEYGALFEAEPVSTLADLNDVNKCIDRWLKPIGLTGFKEPLQEVEKLVQRISKKNKNPFALFFMSDGCDNQWNRADILKVVEQTAGGLVSSTFVEYGYYADRMLLSAMAEKAGGTLIFAEAFDKYEPVFEAAMQKRPVGGKRIEVDVGGDPIGGFAWTMEGQGYAVGKQNDDGSRPLTRPSTDGDLVTYNVSTGKAIVPEFTQQLYYLSPTPVGVVGSTLSDQSEKFAKGAMICAISPAHAALSLFAVRMKPEIVYPILKALGDVAFIERFSICFGKQKYSEFMDAAKLAAFDEGQRFTKGRDPKKVPADDAFTVLDLLRLLAEDESARLLLDHPEFKYSRVSRKRVDADENLSADEQLQIETIRSQMAGEKSVKKLKEYQAEIDKILASKKEALKFIADSAPDGYAISNLTYNECRPNISVLVKKAGHVDLSSRPDHKKYKIPTDFETHVWRNYTIVCDGLVNVEKLPVTISEATWKALQTAGVQAEAQPGAGKNGVGIVVIDLKPLPIINREMVKAVSAKSSIELEWALLKSRAAQKVYKHYQNELFPGVKLKSLADLYGKDGAEWLKEQGITYNGFSPKTVQAESKDFIIGKELEIKLKGCSKLDSVKAVKEKTGKKNPCDVLMSDAIDAVESYLKKNPKNLHEKWLTGKTDTATAETRGLIYQTAQTRFAIIVGQVWFQEFGSLDENTLKVNVDGQEITGIAELREVEIKI